MVIHNSKQLLMVTIFKPSNQIHLVAYFLIIIYTIINSIYYLMKTKRCVMIYFQISIFEPLETAIRRYANVASML